MKEAHYYTRLDNNRVRCDLCPHHCRLRDGMRGICLSRENHGGTLHTANYCRPVSLSVDPIEKKPLYHFFPGSAIFSTGPNGCTFKCVFCQNAEISQQVCPVREMPVRGLIEHITGSGTIGVAYTYSEPYIWFETIIEVGTRIRELGLKNVMVTNGFMEPEPLAELLPIVDAMNIDIKSIRPSFYRRLCKARLEPVLRTCEQVKKKCHLEITNLVITSENDSDKDIADLAQYISRNLGRDTPLHLSRYFPRYALDHPATSETTLERAFTIAREWLDYVYIGNVRSDTYSDTRCPECNELLIQRRGYSVTIHQELDRAQGTRATACCPHCGKDTGIVMK